MMKLLLLGLLLTLPLAAYDELDGLPNIHAVDDHLIRGAQPLEFDKLAALGVVKVINLRKPLVGEAEQCRRYGIDYVSIPMPGLSAPSLKDAMRALGEIFNTKGTVFVHCQHGSDRTGTIVALYRMITDNWTSDLAIAEAREYGMSWVQFSMRHFIRAFEKHHIARGGTVPAHEETPINIHGTETN